MASSCEERREKARRYERLQNWLFLADQALFLVLAGAVVLGGDGSLALRCWRRLSEACGGGFWLPGLAFIVLGHLAYVLVTAPYEFYKDYVLEKRFDLSNQTPGGWLWDFCKSLLLGTALLALCLMFCYFAMDRLGNLWFLAAAGGWIFLQVVLGVLFPVLLLPIFYHTEPLAEHPAAAGLLALTEGAGLKVTGLYRFDMSEKTKKANAMLCGLFATRRVLLSDTLLTYEPEEIVAVMAHEVGHYKRAHIWKLAALHAVLILAGLYLLSLALSWYCGHCGLELREAGSYPFFLLFFSVWQLLTMPLTNGFSRRCEREADLWALKTLGSGRAFASALRRLAEENLAVLEISPLIEFFLYSHPVLGKRIALAEHWSEK